MRKIGLLAYEYEVYQPIRGDTLTCDAEFRLRPSHTACLAVFVLVAPASSQWQAHQINERIHTGVHISLSDLIN